MDYAAPEPADIRDAQAINLAYIESLRNTGTAQGVLPGELAARLRRLDRHQALRLSRAPFLLLSLSEHDGALWKRLLGREPGDDLFAARDETGPGQARLLAAAIGFVWRLCRHDMHAARLVAGAPAAWCEALAASPLVEIVERAGRQPGLMVPRLAGDRAFWQRLLGAGVHEDESVRRAAQLTAHHAVLMQGSNAGATRLAAAACRFSPVAVRKGPPA